MGMKIINHPTASFGNHMRTSSLIGTLTALLLALAGSPLVNDCQAQAPQQPPFDFSDAFYLANGINPANLLTHVDGTCPANDHPSCSVVDNSDTDPNRRNIRGRSTTGGFYHDGTVLYYSIFGRVVPRGSRSAAPEPNARSIAN